MKKKCICLVLPVLLACMAMIMASCGGAEEEPMTFEKYLQSNEELMESFSATDDDDYKIEVKGNDVIYTTDLSMVDGYTKEIAKSAEVVSFLEDHLDVYSEFYGEMARGYEMVSEVSGIRVIVNYTWGNEVIASRTYTSQDASSSE